MNCKKYLMLIVLSLTLFITACSLFETSVEFKVTEFETTQTSVSFNYELIKTITKIEITIKNDNEIVTEELVNNTGNYRKTLFPEGSRDYELEVAYYKIATDEESVLLYSKSFTLDEYKPTIEISFSLKFPIGLYDENTLLQNFINNTTITDEIDGNITPVASMFDVSLININQTGVYPLIISATNQYGKNSVLELEIEISSDITPPTIELKNDLKFEIGINYYTLINSFIVYDDVDTIRISQSDFTFSNPVNFNIKGEYPFILTVRDTSGNVTSESYILIIDDTTKPSITPTFSSSKLVIEVKTTNFNYTSYFSIYDASGIDSKIFDDSAINYNILGTYTLNVSATDKNNNTNTLSVEVEIVDITSPVISISEIIAIEVGEQLPDIYSLLTISDNYDTILKSDVTIITEDVNIFEAGVYPVFISVSDKSNNRTDLIVNVTVGGYPEVETTEGIEKLWAETMPSVGDVKVLVIPIGFSNYSKTEQMRTNINKGFFGTESDTGWESLKTYYEKSSYGKLNISGTVTSWFTPQYSQSYYATYEDSNNYIYGSTLLLYEALTYYKNTINYNDYDSDNDGYIDAVYLIYNCPIGGNQSSAQYDFYWAYVFWDYARDRSYNGMDAFSYMFAGYDFFKEESRSGQSLTLNAETFIHETGHLMGLDDYYDYHDKKGLDGGYGGADMMDHNIGDHNPYSKSLLRWVNPRVVTFSSEITLTSFTLTGMYLLVPIGSYKGLFTEYFIIDFFTIEGVNTLGMADFLNAPSGQIAMGVRISHVNAELVYDDGYDFKYSSTVQNSQYKQIRWLEADYNDSKFDCDSNNYTVEYDDFFTPTSKQFGYDNFINYKTYTNKALPFKMKVLSMNNSSVRIEITLN